jgi:hypothetical protein
MPPMAAVVKGVDVSSILAEASFLMGWFNIERADLIQPNDILQFSLFFFLLK